MLGTGFVPAVRAVGWRLEQSTYGTTEVVGDVVPGHEAGPNSHILPRAACVGGTRTSIAARQADGARQPADHDARRSLLLPGNRNHREVVDDEHGGTSAPLGARLYGVFNPSAIASSVSWSPVQYTSVSAVRSCGPRISDRNSAMSSRPQRSRYSASAS